MCSTLQQWQDTANRVGWERLQMHLGWRLYLLRNVPATWCYRAINYAFAPVGSDAQIFLSAEAAKGNCTELKDAKDQYVEFGYDTTSQELFWSAVDVKNSTTGDNKFGCKINFCLCVDVARLSALYEKTHEVPHFQQWEKEWRPTSFIIAEEKRRTEVFLPPAAEVEIPLASHSGKTNAGQCREIFRALW
jgi:hypothetical protein